MLLKLPPPPLYLTKIDKPTINISVLTRRVIQQSLKADQARLKESSESAVLKAPEALPAIPPGLAFIKEAAENT